RDWTCSPRFGVRKSCVCRQKITDRNALCFQAVARASLRRFLGRPVFLVRGIKGPIPTPCQFADPYTPRGIVFFDRGPESRFRNKAAVGNTFLVSRGAFCRWVAARANARILHPRIHTKK